MEHKHQNSMTHRTRFRSLCILLLCCLTSSMAHASSYQLIHTFLPDEPENAPFFGSAVVLEDGIAAIKSNSGYVDGDGLSVTHIFEEGSDSSWSETATLSYDSGDEYGNHYIGRELAIDNGEIVISYGLSDREPTSSHLQFATKDANGWSVQFNEPTPDPLPREKPIFAQLGPLLPGRSVDISGNLAIVEDYSSNIARVYQKSEEGLWSESANLIPPEDSFDISGVYDVAIDGNSVIVGERSSLGSNDVYFYESDLTCEWALTNQFNVGNSPSPLVDIDGDTAFVVDTRIDIIYIFQRAAGLWSQTAEINVADFGGFIQSVAIENGIIAYSVNTIGDTPSQINFAHETSHGIWETFKTISDPHPELEYVFGDSLALGQGRLLVGAPNWSPEGSPGAAYLFTQVPEPSSALLVLFASTLGCLSRHRSS